MGVKMKGLCGWWILALLSVSSLVAQDRDLRLVDAVKNGEQETLRLLLKEGVDVNIAQVDGATALHWAAHRNDLTSTELLIGIELAVGGLVELLQLDAGNERDDVGSLFMLTSPRNIHVA